MVQFRVSRFLKRDLVVRVNSVNDKGLISNSRKLFEFYPGGDTETDGWYETSDEVLIDSIRNLKETIPFSANAERGLQQDGVVYEYTYCKSCGNKRVKKLEYNLFEVE